MVSFTGSSVVGRQVMAAAGATMKRILLECGGKSAAIILDDVEVTDELVQRILFDGCSLHAGQACILQSRLLAPDRLHDEWSNEARRCGAARAGGRPAGPGGADGSAHQPGAAGPRRSTRRRGARRRRRADCRAGDVPAGLETGYYYEPTILTDVRRRLANLAQEEVFGPVLAVLRYGDEHEAVDIANNSSYGLSGAVWGTDVDRAVGRGTPGPYRTDRRKRLHPRRCTVRRVQAERAGTRGRRPARIAPVHGAEGHRDTGMTGALAGLRVVEIAGDIAGPYCTKLLADLGAEVTKIEPPSGDPLRDWGPFPGGIPDPATLGMFEYLNAGKRGATIDLDADIIGVALPHRARPTSLSMECAPGALDRFGLDAAALASACARDSSSFASRTSVRTGRCATASPRR